MNLVTGATGHIGNVLVRQLLEQGEKVRALILPQEDLIPLRQLEVELMIGDVNDIDSLRRAMRGVDVVFHLAGVISIMPGMRSILERVNVEGTRNMARTAMEMGVRRFIYTSSIHALARVKDGILIDESVPFDPAQSSGEYDRSKAMASLEVLRAVKDGLDAVIVCPTGVIGPYDYRESEMGKLILDSARQAVSLSVNGSYDFVDVRDVARGEILARDHGKTGQVYILSGEQITIRHLIQTARSAVNLRGAVISLPGWIARTFSQIMPFLYRLTKKKARFTPYSVDTVLGNSKISNQRARMELGFTPRNLRESILDTLAWFTFAKKYQLTAVPIQTAWNQEYRQNR